MRIKGNIMNDHVPDIERIPRALRCCTWERVDCNTKIYDGERLIAAVPVRDSDDWSYELSVLIALVDEHGTELLSDGEGWGWELSDADFILRLN